MTAMYDKLAELLITRFDVDTTEIRPDATFEDLEMDSLFLVELLVVVQTELGVKISDDMARPSDTISRVAELIEEQLVTPGGSA